MRGPVPGSFNQWIYFLIFCIFEISRPPFRRQAPEPYRISNLKPVPMKHLGISGGGTKISGLFGAAETILFEKNYRPDIISGISAGAILSVPLAMSLYDPSFLDKIRNLVLNMKQEQFFNKPPVDEYGKIKTLNALLKIISGDRALGEQENLKKTISSVITERDFSIFVHNDDIPVCIVGAVDFFSGKRFYFNLKEVTYQHFLEFVNASGSLPIFTPGFYFEGDMRDFEGETSGHPRYLLFDGGVRDHSPTNKILSSKRYGSKIKETATLFSRPEHLPDILDPKEFDGKKDILTILSRYVDITNAEVSKNDKERETELIAQNHILDRGTIYLPRVLTNVYDTNPEKIRELYRKGKEAVEKYWNPISYDAFAGGLTREGVIV